MMEPLAPPLDSIATALIKLGGDVAYTVDAELVRLIARPGILPTLKLVDWTEREFTFQGPPVQMAANLVTFWSICHGLDWLRYPSPCPSSRDVASGDAPRGHVPLT